MKKNQSIFSGKFKEDELKLYKSLTKNDIQKIIDYQKVLPCLQGDYLDSHLNRESLEKSNKQLPIKVHINGRVLHEQLKASRKFADWIRQQLEELNAKEGIEFFLSKGKTLNINGGRTSIEYLLTIETAKEIAMIAGVKGGRTNKELKERSQLARKYFIAIEKAFKERQERNYKRQQTIDTYHDLRKIIFRDLFTENKLGEYLPHWWDRYVKDKKNTYAYELYLLDVIIIGMSALKYREIHNLPRSKQIRDTFTKEQLADFEMLQSKSAEHIKVYEVWDTNKRFKMLKKFYKYYKDKVRTL